MKIRIKTKYSLDETIFAVFFIFAWIVIAFNYKNPDYVVYKETYEVLAQTGTLINEMEFGYVWLMRIAIALEIPFPWFWGVLTSVALILIADSFYHYTYNPGMAMVLYVMTCLLFDCVVFRSFLALALILMAFQYSKSKKYVFALLVLMSMSISAMSVVYLPFLLISDKKIKTKTYVKAFFCVMICVLLFRSTIVNFVSKYYPTAGRYIDPIQDTYKPFLVYTCLYVLGVVFLRKIGENSTGQTRVIYNASLYVLLLMPLLLLELTYARIYRFGLLLLFLVAASAKVTPIRRKREVYLFCVGVFAIAIINAVLFYGVGNNRVTILENIFEHNYVFDWLF